MIHAMTRRAAVLLAFAATLAGGQALAQGAPKVKFATSLGFVFMKVPGKGFEQNPNDYSVDHSANIALLDPQGRLAGLIRPPFKPAAIADDLTRLSAAERKNSA